MKHPQSHSNHPRDRGPGSVEEQPQAAGGPTPGETWTMSAAMLLAAAIFAVDLSLPLGVAAGVPYVAVILFGWWLERTNAVIWLAALCTILVALGYLFSPEGGTTWVVLLNRTLAVFAVWVTAALVTRAKGLETRVRAARDEATAFVRSSHQPNRITAT